MTASFYILYNPFYKIEQACSIFLSPYKNVSIGAYYGFANKDMDGNHLGDYWRTDVNFMF